MGLDTRNWMRRDARPAREGAGHMDAARVGFLKRTYTHLALAIVAFVGVEAALQASPFVEPMVRAMSGRFAWLVVIGLFMAVAWAADRLARSTASRGAQYAGLGLYVMAQSIHLCTAALYGYSRYGGDGILVEHAAIVTLGVSGALTAYAADFWSELLLASGSRTWPQMFDRAACSRRAESSNQQKRCPA